MTSKITKMLMLTALLMVVVIPASVYAVDSHTSQNRTPEGNIGKVADGTFDERLALAKLDYLMRDQIDRGVSHETEIQNIETEYQKLYQMDSNLRMEYQQLADILTEKMEIHHSDQKKSVQERMSELPIIGIGVSGKTKSLDITLDEDYVTEADIPKWEKQIKNMVSRSDVPITIRISAAPTLDSHTSNRETTTVDPLKGGASVGFMDGTNNITCSVGYYAKEGGSNDLGFVSAGHCTQLTGYGQTGINVHQPVATTTNNIAVVDKEQYSSSTYCDCSWNEFNTGESGVAKTMYSLTSDFPVTSQYTITSNSEGLAVYKSGAKTGYSVGVIDLWQTTIYIPSENATLKNVVRNTYTAQGGDSGGAVMRLNGIAGIHVAHDASYTYAVTVSRTNAYLGVAPVFS